MTTDTHPNIESSTVPELAEMALTTMKAIDTFIPEIRMVSGLIPYGGAIVQGVTMINPLIERVLMFAMAQKGHSFTEALMDFVQHMTPGMPDSPTFSQDASDDPAKG